MTIKTLMTVITVRLTVIASCCANKEARLIVAAESRGKAAAGVHLPDLPDECRQKMARVIPKYGTEKPRNTQLRWDLSADFVDRRTLRCASFYDGVQTRYGAKDIRAGI
ncbi:hypothetical protein [Agrobacterium larrymoorei]|uniref:Uncharacterized protein n=1 Tax=Agrobacterium larrymoorei TaxID=160699 RepID=A0AAJ2BG50_9HYPH|nr:hypothetical protein [Agrobacterium larrymoorei]MDQ1186099.1 hypothetical protein [Agrobacterium larrymoorei]MDR6102321.1 hypothetical protein [Agrobacterium larrymoorei]